MRKVITFIFLLFVILTSALASTAQKIYPVNSDIYQSICDLYLMTGHAMPSSTGPWSAAELMTMLDGISISEIPHYLHQDYEDLYNRLSEDLDDAQFSGISMEFGGALSVESYSHTNIEGQTREDKIHIREKLFVGKENWAYDLTHANPFLNLEMEIDIKDHSYIYFALPLQSSFHTAIGYSKETGNSYVDSNIPGLNNAFDANSPYRAFVSFGSDNWSLQIGRDRISWGLGTTGNMVISDNLPYHDFAKWSVFSNRFKFTFLVSSFPHKINFYIPSYKGSNTDDDGKNEGISLYIAHRLEGRFLNDKLSISITEAIMYASETGVINPKALNPATIFHNLYNASDTNSTLALEVDYTPIKSLNLYLQLIVDDLAVFGEDIASPSSEGYPNCIGVLSGITYKTKAFEGLFSFNLEGAYTSPYLYLRYNSKNDHYSGSDEYGLDYVVAVRSYSGDDSVIFDEYFLGYGYGCDAIVANLNIGWKDLRKLSISSNLFFMAHGTHDKWTKWKTIGNDGEEAWNKYSETPTSGHQTTNYKYTDADSRNAVTYTLDLGLYVSYEILRNWTAYSQVDYVTIWNAYNRSENGLADDFQIVLGAKYSF